MDQLVTTITKFKAKQGLESQLIEALRSFDNSSFKYWQILSLRENENAAINTYESITPTNLGDPIYRKLELNNIIQLYLLEELLL